MLGDFAQRGFAFAQGVCMWVCVWRLRGAWGLFRRDARGSWVGASCGVMELRVAVGYAKFPLCVAGRSSAVRWFCTGAFCGVLELRVGFGCASLRLRGRTSRGAWGLFRRDARGSWVGPQVGVACGARVAHGMSCGVMGPGEFAGRGGLARALGRCGYPSRAWAWPRRGGDVEKLV